MRHTHYLKQRVAGVAVDSRVPWTAVKRSCLNMTKYHILEAEGKSWLQNPSSCCRNEVVHVPHPWTEGWSCGRLYYSVSFCRNELVWTFHVPHSCNRGGKSRLTLEFFELLWIWSCWNVTMYHAILNSEGWSYGWLLSPLSFLLCVGLKMKELKDPPEYCTYIIQLSSRSSRIKYSTKLTDLNLGCPNMLHFRHQRPPLFTGYFSCSISMSYDAVFLRQR